LRSLSQLIENSNTRIELARSALDRAKRFSLQRMTNAYLKVYGQLHQLSRKRIEYSRTGL
jgi:glycosyltransferase involved in cell wall biosynthesis